MGLVNNEALKKIQTTIIEKESTAQLVAVTKTRPLAAIEELYALGIRDFGENRLEELETKARAWPLEKEIRWHFIGNLQSNKIRELLQIPNLHSIHSITSLKHLEKIAARIGLSPAPYLQIYLQINTSHEEEKSGFEDDVLVIERALQTWTEFKFKQAKVVGLMTMATLRTEDPRREAHRCFSRLRELALELEPKWGKLQLSMGMSGDYEIALDQGADVLRIGSHLYFD